MNRPVSRNQDLLPSGITGEAAGRMQDAAERTVIREMTRADLDRVGQILYLAFHKGAVAHGYAPRIESAREGTAWAWAVLRHAPQVILVAETDGRVTGICCLHPRGDHGGIGPVAVDPASQGKGIGRLLMEELIRRAEGLQTVRLFQESFNAASFSLYYSLGLLPVADLLDMTAPPDSGGRPVPCGPVVELAAHDLEDAVAYDAPRSKYDRRTDLAYYATWGKVFVHRQGTAIRGLLACLPGQRSVQFGPLVAEGEEEAGCLFRHARSVYGDRQCQTRVMARDRSLVRDLRELGFRTYCLNMLMVRGTWRPDRYVEAFGRFPEGT